MGLIKCPECGKEISDMAQSCPNCGYPLHNNKNNVQRGVNVYGTWDQSQQQVKNHRKKSHGCLTSILVMVFVVAFFATIILVAINSDNKNSKKKDDLEEKPITENYIDVSHEQGIEIDSILKKCGIDNIVYFAHDELLDNAHIDGETGYRITINKNTNNIILYLASDKSVYMIRYNDNDLYKDGAVVSTIQDYIVSSQEASKWMTQCEESVKTVLKSPSTAKFPNITEWRFEQNKNIVTVQGYVDAQNSFGAELRSQFQIIIDTDTNTIQSFIFDGQEMIQQ